MKNCTQTSYCRIVLQFIFLELTLSTSLHDKYFKHVLGNATDRHQNSGKINYCTKY